MTDRQVRVCSVVGARPQFIKAAVVSRALSAVGIEEDLVHTGQHHDPTLSDVFLNELELPEVSINLNAGSASHAVQTGQIMVRLEAYLQRNALYDLLMVYGDTNSTLAAALVGAKLHIPLAHVEAGLRSFNRTMPEEVNRIVTDRLSRLLFCPSETAVRNLSREGITDGVINTGDVMYDALLTFLPKARVGYPLESIVPFEAGEYYLATLHRAENTDDPSRLAAAVRILEDIDRPVVWPIHPRAAKCLSEFDIVPSSRVHRIPPCGYLAILSLLEGAAAVLTDSGGLQKEAFWLSKPCVTMRAETEWVETVGVGNVVADLNRASVTEALRGPPPTNVGSPYGRGDAATKVAACLHQAVSGAPMH